MWWRRLRYVLLLVSLCAIATCPAAQRSCTAKSRAREAEQLLGYLAERVEAAITATGHVPEAAAGPTPAPPCCERDGGTCAPDPAQWAVPAWQALAFSIDNEHRYTYSYLPAAGGRSAVLRATGDLDCDGVPGIYELEIRIEAAGPVRTWTRKDPFE